MMKLPLVGLFRVGTNYTRAVLEANYDVEVVYSLLGWKHGLIPTFSQDSQFCYPDIGPLVVVKDPLSTFVSWFEYIRKNGKNLRTQSDSFSSFLRSPIVFFNESDSMSPEYIFSTPVEMWNAVVWNHSTFAEKAGGYVVKYEDLLTSPEGECERIARHYGLPRKTVAFENVENRVKNMNDSAPRLGDREKYVTQKVFSKTEYFLNREYLKEFGESDLRYVFAHLNKDLITKFEYERDSGESTAAVSRAATSKPELFTMCSDGRAADLAVFLESVSRFEGYAVKVIPFDDSLSFTRRICDLYGAQIIEPSPVWDSIGKSLFGENDHRSVGVKAWRFFRKFNAITSAEDDFVFLDANSVLLQDLGGHIPRDAAFDVLFGHRSLPGRNFAPWAHFVVNKINPYIKNGFGAGFWYVRKGALEVASFKEIAKRPALRRMLSVAPEQSLLNIVVAMERRDVKLIKDVSDSVYVMCGKKSAEYNIDVSGAFVAMDGKPIVVAKWTGDYNGGKFAFPQKQLHRRFVNSVMEKVRHDSELSAMLIDRYQRVYGHADLMAHRLLG